MRNEALRVRRFLQKGAAAVEAAGGDGVLLNAPERGAALRLRESLFCALLEHGAIVRDGDSVRLGEGGEAWDRFAAARDPLGARRAT